MAATTASVLARDLRARIRGQVRIDAGARALYATDASNYRQLPIAVITPRDEADVVAAVAVCRDHQLPVLARGGGTSLAGQGCNTAVVLDFSRHMNNILELNPDARTATVQPGVVLDDLRDAAARHGLTFGPDPATHSRCTLGGMIGNNSCGVHSIMAGRTADNVLELDILTYDGHRMRVGPTSPEQLDQIIAAGGRRAGIYAGLAALRDRCGDQVRERFPGIPRRVSGYNLDELLPERGFHVARALVGAEGTCVLVLAATLRLVPAPPQRRTVVLGFADGPAAADAVPGVMEHHPVGLEGFDGVLMADVRKLGLQKAAWDLLPGGGGWLLAELGGDTAAEADAAASDLAAGFDHARLLTDQEAPRVWGIRESGLGATARVPGQRPAWPGWEDSAVDPARLGDYLRELRKLCDRYGYHAALYGHFGQGCVHTRIDFDLGTAAGVATFRSFMTEAAKLCVRFGGSLSGEHGDGQARAELLPIMFGSELVNAFAEFKRIWDPGSMMNPHKVVDASPLDAHLRLGRHYRPRQLATNFAFADDGGDFARAVSRCVGVGACRAHSGTVMCPSYQATREEEHSTRGRAHLLFELLNGAEMAGRWRDPHVKDALDLCMSCKGCKHDCPVDVDMARYKAEFLSHWYSRRVRPPAAYTMGLMMYGARLASAAPGLANSLTHAPGVSALAKRLAGVHPDRDASRFAPAIFRRAWARRPAPPPGTGMPVLLWPDTFTDHFHPRTGVAAVRVFEDAGCSVSLPAAWVCCGRPLYDWGMLAHARQLLTRTLSVIGDEIDAGVPVVVLEPSCASVFREELTDLLPRDRRASRLAAQTYTLAEFLGQHRPDWSPPALAGPLLAHGHCHDRSVLDFAAEQQLLERAGAAVTYPRRAAAGWPVRPGSRPPTTTSRGRSASRTCCPRSGPPRRRPPWSPMASAAASRSARAPAGHPFTSPTHWPEGTGQDMEWRHHDRHPDPVRGRRCLHGAHRRARSRRHAQLGLHHHGAGPGPRRGHRRHRLDLRPGCLRHHDQRHAGRHPGKTGRP
jgi:FAD/FMN-containing dehydrogenase/Fe-S oxidoreductase